MVNHSFTYRQTLNLHLLHCPCSKSTIVGTFVHPPPRLESLFEEFKHWCEALREPVNCQHFLPWLLVEREMVLVESSPDVSDMILNDEFWLPRK